MAVRSGCDSDGSRRAGPLLAIVAVALLAGCPSNGQDEPDVEVSPNAPTWIEGWSSFPDEVDLWWTDDSQNEDGFVVEMKGPDDMSFVVVETVATDVTDLTIGGLTYSTPYIFRVCAFNGTGSSPYTAEIQVTTASRGELMFIEHTITSAFNGAERVSAIDVDDDGDVDVLGAASQLNRISWFENDGAGGFTEHIIASDFSLAWDILGADLDGDGDVDVIASSWDWWIEGISWWENDGQENFTVHAVPAAADFTGVTSIDVVDLNEDGDLDIIGAANNSDEFAWFENDGEENFTKHTMLSTYDAYCVDAVDADGDDDIDIIACTIGTIMWLENDGSEAFTQNSISAVFDARFVAGADMDGDGDIDIAGAGYYGNTICWFENDGSQGYTQHLISDDQTGGNTAIPVDFDADGDMDLLTAASQEREIVWWENDGDESFAGHVIDSGCNGAKATYPADLNGDGDLDVLTSSYTLNEIQWWEAIYWSEMN